MIYLGADHRGFQLKEIIKDYLDETEKEYEDLGAFEIDPNDDYPVYAKRVADHVQYPEDRGIVICGSGVGVDEVANKVAGVRSGLAINRKQIEAARHDDDINVLALASDHTPEEEAKGIVKVFLETGFSGEERYIRRINEIRDLESEE
ncbi:MAG TPA: RpiB/LacA/LacB family sugar-phosphate isomerase, partial [Candidatus Paceibacterota bacterium]